LEEEWKMKKKTFFAALAWVLTALLVAGEAVPASAQKPTVTQDELGSEQGPALARDQYGTYQSWIEQLDGGFIFPVSPLASKNYNPGVGGDVLVGYRFDRDLSLSADLGYYAFNQKAASGEGGQWNYVPLMGVVRYNFGHGWVRPYVLMGLGVALNSYSTSAGHFGESSTGSPGEANLLVCPGLGILCKISGETALYLQARADINFVGSGSLPASYADSLTLFIPFDAGLMFFVI
jgi:hypothetical protein